MGDLVDEMGKDGSSSPPPAAKHKDAFRTIGELAAELGVPQHILRYWETRFPELRPLTRAGNRRYYRPEDVALVRRIDQALNRDGYTIKGVQRLLAGGQEGAAHSFAAPAHAASGRTDDEKRAPRTGDRHISAQEELDTMVMALREIREQLRRMLDAG